MSTISRRGFLKLSGAGLAGAFLPTYLPIENPTGEHFGRVLETSVKMYAAPTIQSTELDTFWKDSILPITEVTIGVGEPAFNRIWYVINGDGYVHSGGIQPVNKQINPVVVDIPPTGVLAEVTVPFTDAHWGVGKRFPVAYRMYYETTHWVVGIAYDDTDAPWYNIAEDKWQLTYYIPAPHLRIIPNEELTPLSPEVPAHARRMEVHTAEQYIVAYEYDRPVFMARTATGARFSNGNFSTPPGRHITAQKRPSRHMAAGNLAANGYDLPGVPWISYITESGISFHGTYWHNNYGRPRSHGCINLTPKAAKWVYRWTTPVVPPAVQFVYEESGTIVDVI
jgi:lipoprotein-anchoring transpeptidase ErfK/SrfK